MHQQGGHFDHSYQRPTGVVEATLGFLMYVDREFQSFLVVHDDREII
jgi:hypothetical protein